MLFVAGIIHVFGNTKGRKEGMTKQNLIEGNVVSEETVETEPKVNRFYRRALAKVGSPRQLLVKAIKALSELLSWTIAYGVAFSVIVFKVVAWLVSSLINLIIALFKAIYGVTVGKAVKTVKAHRSAKTETSAEAVVEVEAVEVAVS